MAKGQVRKRCNECKRVFAGTVGRKEWCPDDGGEMIAIRYGKRRPGARGR